MACQPPSNMYLNEPFDMSFEPQPDYFPATPGIGPNIPEFVHLEEAQTNGEQDKKPK